MHLEAFDHGRQDLLLFGECEMSENTDVHGSSRLVGALLISLFVVQIAFSLGCPGSTEAPQSVTMPSTPSVEKGVEKDNAAGGGSGARQEPERKVESSDESQATNTDVNPVSGFAAGGEPSPEPSNELPVFEELYKGWTTPELALFVSGRQHGYIEPCGCAGLENQKGGLLRRHTCLEELKAKGWEVVPVDLGNQVRRFGAQASIKFTRTVEALTGQMNYEAIGLGPDDLKLPSTDLIQAIVNSSEEEHVFTSANVELFGDFLPKIQVVEAKGHKLGITSVLGSKASAEVRNDDADIQEPVPSLKNALSEMNEAGCELRVLLAFSTLEETKALIQACPEFDLVITAGGDGEPTLHPEMVEAEGRKIPMVQVGVKGMYVGVVGWFPGTAEPLRYQRVPLDARFSDSEDLKQVFQQYQQQLETLGLSGLEISPVAHPSGQTYVGSEACGECHTTAYEIWKHGVDGSGGPHFGATDSLVNPGERTWVQRHFDPECLSCHVTGWNPQRYFPYEGGFLDLEASADLHGNGCENCHGPGSKHVAAENGDLDVSEDELKAIQRSMQVKLEATQCMECHDLDNSPDFHVDGAFEKYWARIVHEGKD
jgi:hypothetical protein